MNKPTTLREEWKQEFRKKFVVDFGDDIKPNLIIHEDIMEIADWWLDKFSAHSTELLSKIDVQISMLRQWLNEDRITDPEKMVTNEQIKVFINQEK